MTVRAPADVPRSRQGQGRRLESRCCSWAGFSIRSQHDRFDDGLARISHQVTAADADLSCFRALWLRHRHGVRPLRAPCGRPQSAPGGFVPNAAPGARWNCRLLRQARSVLSSTLCAARTRVRLANNSHLHALARNLVRNDGLCSKRCVKSDVVHISKIMTMLFQIRVCVLDRGDGIRTILGQRAHLLGAAVGRSRPAARHPRRCAPAGIPRVGTLPGGAVLIEVNDRTAPP